jgi:hypothetical protein
MAFECRPFASILPVSFLVAACSTDVLVDLGKLARGNAPNLDQGVTQGTG